jgi:hypothetical protein
VGVNTELPTSSARCACGEISMLLAARENTPPPADSNVVS